MKKFKAILSEGNTPNEEDMHPELMNHVNKMKSSIKAAGGKLGAVRFEKAEKARYGGRGPLKQPKHLSARAWAKFTHNGVKMEAFVSPEMRHSIWQRVPNPYHPGREMMGEHHSEVPHDDADHATAVKSAISQIHAGIEHRKNSPQDREEFKKDPHGYVAKHLPGVTYKHHEQGDYNWHDGPHHEVSVEHRGAKAIVHFPTPDVEQKHDYEMGGHVAYDHGGKRYTYTRRGIDGHSISFNRYEPLHQSLRNGLEKAKAGIDKRVDLTEKGVEVNFGPIKKTMYPADVESMKQQLKAGKRYSVEPHGFGWAHVFSKNRPRHNYGVGRAHEDFEKLVGHPVYFEKEDRD